MTVIEDEEIVLWKVVMSLYMKNCVFEVNFCLPRKEILENKKNKNKKIRRSVESLRDLSTS